MDLDLDAILKEVESEIDNIQKEEILRAEMMPPKKKSEALDKKILKVILPDNSSVTIQGSKTPTVLEAIE